MFDHLSFGVANIERTIVFYDLVLAPLLVRRCVRFGSMAAYGPDDRPMFWLSDKPTTSSIVAGEGTHIAFQASSRSAVDAFYANAIAAGAQDNGKPGLRSHYHPNYYAAFVIDPDGHRLEAVCHTAE